MNAEMQANSAADRDRRYAIASDGRRYLLATSPFRLMKDEWWREGPDEQRSMLRRR